MKIKVDYKALQQTATVIDDYIARHRKIMSKIDVDVDSMGVYWKGADYDQLRNEWKEIRGVGSTSDEMLKALEDYSGFLKFAAKKYNSAQVAAIRRANSLPKF